MNVKPKTIFGWSEVNSNCRNIYPFAFSGCMNHQKCCFLQVEQRQPCSHDCVWLPPCGCMHYYSKPSVPIIESLPLVRPDESSDILSRCSMCTMIRSSAIRLFFHTCLFIYTGRLWLMGSVNLWVSTNCSDTVVVLECSCLCRRLRVYVQSIL